MKKFRFRNHGKLEVSKLIDDRVLIKSNIIYDSNGYHIVTIRNRQLEPIDLEFENHAMFDASFAPLPDNPDLSPYANVVVKAVVSKGKQFADYGKSIYVSQNQWNFSGESIFGRPMASSFPIREKPIREKIPQFAHQSKLTIRSARFRWKFCFHRKSAFENLDGDVFVSWNKVD